MGWTVYQTTETIKLGIYRRNTYNFQQDVFLVYLEADEMDLETTTC